MTAKLRHQPERGRNGGLPDEAGLCVQLHHVLRAKGGVRAQGEEIRPRNLHHSQAPKFSSESKRVFGLCADAALAVRPMARAVVTTKVS